MTSTKMKKYDEKVAYLIEINKKINSLTDCVKRDALVFDTYEAMMEWLSNEDNVNSLRPGQSIFIKDENTPDYWFTGDEIKERKGDKVHYDNSGDDLETLHDTIISEVMMLIEHFVSSSTSFDTIYPIGSVIFRIDNVDPSTLFPGTKWSRLEANRYIRVSSTTNVGSTGGSSTSGATALTYLQMPRHSHVTWDGSSQESDPAMSFNRFVHHLGGSSEFNRGTQLSGSQVAGKYLLQTGSAGGGGSHDHSITPPYLNLSCWKRIQ